jgi:hypothetical protein
MDFQNVIEVIEQTPVGEVKREMSQEQFAQELIGFHKTRGAKALGEWLNGAGLSFEDALNLIGPEVINTLPETAQWKDGGLFSPTEYLLEMGKEYAPKPDPRTDAEAAVQGYYVHDARLQQLANTSDAMTTPQLEQALRDAGMLEGGTSLMR